MMEIARKVYIFLLPVRWLGDASDLGSFEERAKRAARETEFCATGGQFHLTRIPLPRQRL
jgi:hypothetical protein